MEIANRETGEGKMLSFGLRPACRRRAPRTAAAGRESARPGSTRWAWVGTQLSKSDTGLGDFSKPAERPGRLPSLRIFLLFPLPVKATRRGDNQE